MKIYIIGSTGSGKTTLSKKLSNKYNITTYELDKLVYDDDHDHRKRTNKEIQKLFLKIINKKNWIIEDVGRHKFIEGKDKADIIYYINLKRSIVYKQVIKRWIKQRIGKESYNYPPTILQLFDMIKVTRDYYKKENKQLKELEKYNKKVIFLNSKEDIEKL